MLRRNSNLKILQIPSELLMVAIEQLPTADYLKISFSPGFGQEVENIHCKKIKSLEVRFNYCISNNKREIPLSFDQVDELTLVLGFFDTFDLNHILLHFIRKNPSLSKLNVNMKWVYRIFLISCKEKMELAKAHYI